MPGRASLLVCVGFLAAGLALLPGEGGGTGASDERALAGTWVLTLTEHLGAVTAPTCAGPTLTRLPKRGAFRSTRSITPSPSVSAAASM
jgi:hypothetical protein